MVVVFNDVGEPTALDIAGDSNRSGTVTGEKATRSRLVDPVTLGDIASRSREVDPCTEVSPAAGEKVTRSREDPEDPEDPAGEDPVDPMAGEKATRSRLVDLMDEATRPRLPGQVVVEAVSRSKQSVDRVVWRAWWDRGVEHIPPSPPSSPATRTSQSDLNNNIRLVKLSKLFAFQGFGQKNKRQQKG